MTRFATPNDSIVSWIGEYAFKGCVNLESIDLHTVRQLSYGFHSNMFEGCTKLKSICLPWCDTPYGIGNDPFNGMSLNDLHLEAIRIIRDNTFTNVVSVKRIYFTTVLQELETNCLNISGLTDIYYSGTQAQWEAITGLSGAGIPQGCTVHYDTPSDYPWVS
jgi:hypothetical protein